MLPVLIDEEGGAELFVAGLKTVPQCGPLFLGQGHDGTDQAAESCIDWVRSCMTRPRKVSSMDSGKGEIQIADMVIVEIVSQTAKTGHD